MIQLNQESGSPPPVKRKRGRPRKDEALTRQESTPITPKPNTVSPDDITGRLVSGVVEGSFDAGYFLNVKVSDSDKQLRGIVFIPEKVTPITAANDVAPHVKMCEREEILVPASNLQAWPQNQQNPQKQTDVIPELQTDVLITDTNQSAPFTKSFPAMQDAAIGSELQFSATAAKNSSACDMKVNDIDNGASSLERNPPQEIARSTPENQALPLMPQSGNDGFSEQCNTVPASMDTMPPEDSGGIPFVDFFPTPEITRPLNLNLEIFRREAELSWNKQHKSPSHAEPSGFNLMADKLSSTADYVPEELQLELGNKTTSRVNLPQLNGGFRNGIPSETIETNPQRASSMSGFLAGLFEGEDAAESVLRR